MILYFILGILLIEAIIPLLEELVSLILSWIKVSEYHASLKAHKLSAAITKIDKESEKDDDISEKRIIGLKLLDDEGTEEEINIEEDDD